MFRKLILIILINLLVFSPLILFPETAQAQGLQQVVVDELANLGIFTSVTVGGAAALNAARLVSVPTFDNVQYFQTQTVEAAKAAKETKSNIIQALFTLLLEILKKRLLDMIVDQIVTWIQGGGAPKFVTNWEGFLRDAGDLAFDTVVKGVGAARICEPLTFGVNVLLAPVPKFSTRIDCTLDKVVKNIRSFYRDFRTGSWLAYEESWAPENNFYALQLQIADEILLESARKAEAARNEALAGKGFLPATRCKGGGLSAAEIEQSGLAGYVRDSKGNYCLPKDLQSITPGNVVGEMASKAVGSDIDYILSAKELEQYISAIVNAAINRVIKEGLSSIKESIQESPDRYTQPYEDVLTELNRREKTRIIAEYEKFFDDREVILANKTQAASTTEQLAAALRQIFDANCLPPVSTGEINNADAEVNRLRTEITNIQTTIAQIQTAKAEAEAISPEYQAGQMEVLVQKYNEFIANNGTLVSETYSGTARTASQTELQGKLDALSAAQNRLRNCGLTP